MHVYDNTYTCICVYMFIHSIDICICIVVYQIDLVHVLARCAHIYVFAYVFMSIYISTYACSTYDMYKYIHIYLNVCIGSIDE